MKRKHKCSVIGCEAPPDGTRIHYHALPAEQERLIEWLTLIKRLDLLNDPTSIRKNFVCTQHFDRLIDYYAFDVSKSLRPTAKPRHKLPPDPELEVVEAYDVEFEDESETEEDVVVEQQKPIPVVEIPMNPPLPQPSRGEASRTGEEEKRSSYKMEILAGDYEEEMNVVTLDREPFDSFVDMAMPENLAEFMKLQVTLSAETAADFDYPDEFKRFVVDLYRISPKALDYLRSMFYLPPINLIRAWNREIK